LKKEEDTSDMEEAEDFWGTERKGKNNKVSPDDDS
jgi:hypothetical protein